MRWVAAGMLAVLALGCAESALARARRLNTPEAWRRVLAEGDGAAGADEATEELASLEFAAAKRAHTVLGYKRYLEEFPRAADAPVAAKLLETLRFDAASIVGTVPALRQFLVEHPDGAHRTEAEARLLALEVSDVRQSTDVKGLQNAASRDRSELGAAAGARLDDVAFEKATGDPRALLGYLRGFPAGAHRDAVRAALLEFELEALAATGAVDNAGKRYEASPMQRALPSWKGREKALKREQAAISKADPAIAQALWFYDVRPVDDLLSALVSVDAWDRWEAAEELGGVSSPAVIDRLLDAVRGDRNVLVRLRAFEAIARVLAALPANVAAFEFARREDAALGAEDDAGRLFDVAVMADAAGRPTEAIAWYRKLFEPAAIDPFIVARVMALREREHRAYSAALSARLLSNWARDAAVEASQSKAASVAFARSLCAASVVARTSLETLKRADTAGTEFLEDVKSFSQTAEASAARVDATLRDVEVKLLSATPVGLKKVCADRDVRSRLTEGAARRRARIATLGTRKDADAQLVLSYAAVRDPDAEVRQAAVVASKGATRRTQKRRGRSRR